MVDFMATLQDVIKDFKLSDDEYYIIKKKDIKIPIRKYKNIEVCKYWYDDESRPDTYCWIDVEGIGYGWMWCANKLCSKLRFLQRRAIRKLAMDLLKPEDENTNILCSDNPNEKVRVYGFIPKGNKNVYIQIRLSDEELTF